MYRSLAVMVCGGILWQSLSGPSIDTNGMEEQEKEKRRLVIEKFQKAPFEEIAAQCESKVSESVRNGSWELILVTGWQDPSFRHNPHIQPLQAEG